jgi:hypothetical protein
VRGIRRAARQPRRRGQPRQIVTHGAGGGERGEIHTSLSARGARHGPAERGERQRDQDHRQRRAEDERQGLAGLAAAPGWRCGARHECSGNAAHPRRCRPAGIEAGEGASAPHEAQRPRRHPHAHAALAQLADAQGDKMTALRHVGADQGAAGLELRVVERLAPPHRRQMRDDDRSFRDDGHEPAHLVAPIGIRPRADPADPATRRGVLEPRFPKALLERPGRRGREQRRPAPRRCAELDDRHVTPAPFGGGQHAERGRGRRAVPRRRQLGGDQEAGRTHPLALTSRRRAIASIGDGGRSLTVTRPPSTSRSSRPRAHPGSAAATAASGSRPAATAIAPASTAPSASDVE